MSRSGPEELCRQIFDAWIWLAKGIYSQVSFDSYVTDRYEEARTMGCEERLNACVTRDMARLVSQGVRLNRLRHHLLLNKADPILKT
jgi:hypothetical protein